MTQPPPSLPSIPVPRLREAARRAVERSSSHEVGKALGLSAPAVRNFIGGAEPRPATLRKLTAWYVREAAAAHELDAETAGAALALLLEGVPASRRAEGIRKVLVAIREVHAEGGVPTPVWATESPG